MPYSRRHFLSYAVAGASLLLTTGTRAADRAARWPNHVLHLQADERSQYPPVVTSARLDPRGERLVTAGDDHRIAVWNVKDGRLLHVLEGHLDWVRTLAFSLEGVLASAGNDRRVLMWDAAAGKRTRDFASLPHAVAAIAFNNDGTLLATAGFSKTVTLFDVATGNVQAELEGPDADLRVMAFSPDGQTLAVAGRSGTIRLWNLETRQVLRDVAAHTRRVRAMLFTPDGAAIVTGGEDRLVQITPVSPGASSTPLPRQSGKVLALALCDERHLAVAGSDNPVRIWNLETKEVMGTLGIHQGSVATLESQGSLLVSGGYDTTVRVWNMSDRVAAKSGVKLE